MAKIDGNDPNKTTLEVTMANGQVAEAFVVKTYGGVDKFTVDKEGNVTVVGDFDLTGSWLHTGDLSITGNLEITGTATLPNLAGPITIAGALTEVGNLALTGNLTQTGNQVVTGNVDISGEFFAKGAMPEADYVIVLDGAYYRAYSCRTGDLLASASGYPTGWRTVTEAAEAALTNGTGVILDMTDGRGPGPTVNRYYDGLFYDEAHYIERKYAPVIQVLSNFDGGAGVEWTGGTDIADNTEYFKRGEKSIQWSSTNAAPSMSSKTFSPALDLRGQHLFLRVYSPDYGIFQHCNGFEMFFLSGSWSHYFGNYIDIPVGWCQGWIEMDIPLFTFDVKAGTPSWSNIAQISIRFYSASGETLTLVFDELSTYEDVMDKGVVVFTFDDFTQGLLEYAKPALDKYGFKGCFCMRASTSYEEYPLQLDVVQDLAEAGWDINNHSVSHGAISDWPLNYMVWDFIKCTRYSEHWGCKAGLDVIVYPAGCITYDAAEEYKRYFKLGMRSNASLTLRSCLNAMHCGSPMSLKRLSCDTYARGTAEEKALLASQYKGVFVILIHHVDPGAAIWTPAEFEAFVDYVASLDVEVLTLSQLAERYGPMKTGRTFRLTSAGFAIDSTGVKTITTAHGIFGGPRIEDVSVTVREDSNVDDWAYGYVKVESVDATNIVCKVNVTTASATASATAKLQIKVDARIA